MMQPNQNFIDLCGRTAIITGASRGIGRKTALTLAGLGANIIVNYAQETEKSGRSGY